MKRYAKAWTVQDFAASAGQTVGGLKVTLHRLRNALLACIRKELGNQEAEA